MGVTGGSPLWSCGEELQGHEAQSRTPRGGRRDRKVATGHRPSHWRTREPCVGQARQRPLARLKAARQLAAVTRR